MTDGQENPKVNGSGQNRKKRFWTVLFILFNIAVIAATAFNEFSGSSAGTIEFRFSNRALFYIGCAVFCLIVFFCAETLKYLLMMRFLGEKVSLRAAFETAAFGKYYDCITPSGSGGQPFQIYWLHRCGYSDGAASSMTIAGYITMQGGFILLALVVFLTWRSVELEAIRYTAYFGLFLCLPVPCLLALFSFRPKAVRRILSAVIRLGGKLKLVKNPEEATERVLEMLDSHHAVFSAIAKDKAVLTGLMFLSVVCRSALCSIPFFVLKMFGAEVGFFEVFATTIYIYASIALIPTPGNAGAAEGAFYLVFSAMGSEGVFWAMLVWRLFTYYSFIIVGAAAYGINALRRKRREGGENA